MWLDKIVEDRIREAMERGEFDNLPGHGKPQDHDAYFAVPEDLRMGYSILKSAGFLPQEAQLLKEIAALRGRLAACSDEAERQRLSRSINDKRLQYDILMERYYRRQHPSHRAGH